MIDIVQQVTGLLKRHPMILAAGQSGSGKETDGDIDLFVYCRAIPSAAEREELMRPLGGAYTAFTGTPGHWGIADMLEAAGAEVWLMYFTDEEAEKEIREILSGEHPDKLDNYYYPVGRLATIQSFSVLHDAGFIESMKRLTARYPEALAEKLLRHHAGALHDTEDMERAVARGDVLFYHFALDLALDHFLQALFALNRVYFPSRKRSLTFIEGFSRKPDNCTQTLLQIVKNGASAAGLGQSFKSFMELADWLNGQVG